MMSAQFYAREGMYEQAIEEMESAIEIASRDTLARINLAAICAMSGNLIQAMKQWEEVSNLEPDNQIAEQRIRKARLLLEQSLMMYDLEP